SDSTESISTAIGLTTIKFANFWKEQAANFDLVFCLGDRYEMFAAVTAAIPFPIKFAHLHGGETSLGAIDNTFRHCITLASTYHFTATATAAAKVAELTGSTNHIYNVGALSLENLASNLLSVEEFKQKWGIDLSKKTILTTYHPETIALEGNQNAMQEIVMALNHLEDYQLLITMPNADTGGSLIRNALIENFQGSDRFFLIENLGSQSYFTAMKHCSFILGNTSSGIIEAASFSKYVVNLGDRQKGREAGENVLQIPVNATAILNTVKQIEAAPLLDGNNIYDNGGATAKIIESLKSIGND
ncbi:MAG: UDP-N-acetylglucosamine 2-epimerase, partial [Daejeonella sp.]